MAHRFTANSAHSSGGCRRKEITDSVIGALSVATEGEAGHQQRKQEHRPVQTRTDSTACCQHSTRWLCPHQAAYRTAFSDQGGGIVLHLQKIEMFRHDIQNLLYFMGGRQVQKYVLQIWKFHKQICDFFFCRGRERRVNAGDW